MLSCDTFVLGKKYYSGGRNCLAKNSDRPLGEAQPIAFYPGGDHPEGAQVKMTHMTIPQAAHTYTVLGCRPYWIWGFEMGVNEKGLVIGNEAEWSRSDAESEEGLLGMDLLRLALERAATAEEGVSVIAGLLEKYGQNANANPLFDRRYENSFLLMDPNEIWLMETAGRRWIAKKIEDWAAISNGYSIGGEYDRASADIETFAREKRWLRPDEPFDFAKAYSRGEMQATSAPRWRRLRKLIGGKGGPLDREDITSILRDHFEDEIIMPRWGGCAGAFATICMHAADWKGSQTAASMICTWDGDLGPIMWYAPSSPCCSVYIPVFWIGEVPECMKNADGTYSENSLWWAAQRLVTLVSADEERFGPEVREALASLEQRIAMEELKAVSRAKNMIGEEPDEDIRAELSEAMEDIADRAMRTFRRLAEDISRKIADDGGLYGARKEFLEAYAERVRMPL